MTSLFFIVPVLFFIISASVIFIVIFTIAKAAKQTMANSNSPVITMNAVVLAKRTSVQNKSEFSHSEYHVSYQLDTKNTYSTYHVTFEFENKSRFELEVPGHEFGILVERDIGELTFQGTQYISFKRHDCSHGQDNSTKRCPYCMSIVKSNADKCKNCGAGF